MTELYLSLQVVHVAYAQQHPLWTGPVVEALRHEDETVTIDFAPFSAQSLILQDVKSANTDGTRNDCTLCCANAPPFEITYDGGETWSLVSRENTVLKDSSVLLTGLAISDGVHLVVVLFTNSVRQRALLFPLSADSTLFL